MSEKLPPLPSLLEQKLTKTGYTRGATVREIYQNRVTRNNTVLIPFEFLEACREPDDGTGVYESGSIVLVEPSWYYGTEDAPDRLAEQGVELGQNGLLIFRRRAEWRDYRLGVGQLRDGSELVVATSRTAPLGGNYFARVHATVAEDGDEIVEGFASGKLRGAGIRVYEYASKATITSARLQLEALVWHCEDAQEAMVSAGMSEADAKGRKAAQLKAADEAGLLDVARLRDLRVLDDQARTVCPLCREPISAADFFKRGEQAEGRETYDLTITEVSLFHIQELRVGTYQHRPYNLGWGHHFCNVVTRDKGIIPTLEWMQQVVRNQDEPLAEVAESVEEAADG